jgi:SAM-dependent methyltransferase
VVKRQNDGTDEYLWRGDHEGRWEHFAADFFGWVRARRPLAGRALEVGCSVGTFVAFAERLGLDVEGVDIDAGAVALGSTRGRRLRRGTIADCRGPYGLVFCNHVLEHIPDPEPFLRRVHEVLAPGGAFAAAMPHVGLEARIKGARWIGWGPSEHYWLYSKDGIARLLERCGFTVEAVEVRNGVAGERWSDNTTSPLALARFVSRKAIRALAAVAGSGCQVFVLATRRN